MKRDATDALVSDLVREAADWHCERCRKYFPPGRARMGLHNSHWWGRGGKSSRYDLDNCDSFCYGCHKFMERARTEYDEFKLKKIGRARYDALVLRANKPRKWLAHEIKALRKRLRAHIETIEAMRAMGYIGQVELEPYD